MTDFTYTDAEYVNSSALDAVAYNLNTKELVVSTHGGSTYKYDNVPSRAYLNLVDPNGSSGRYYATEVKRNYGPGTYLGYYGDILDEFGEAPVRRLATEEVPEGAVGTPKALTYSDKAVVDGEYINYDLHTGQDGVQSDSHYVSLGEVQPSPVSSKFTVHFTVNGGSDVKTHTVETYSYQAAVEALHDVSEALDVNVDVKGVYVHLG